MPNQYNAYAHSYMACWLSLQTRANTSTTHLLPGHVPRARFTFVHDLMRSMYSFYSSQFFFLSFCYKSKYFRWRHIKIHTYVYYNVRAHTWNGALCLYEYSRAYQTNTYVHRSNIILSAVFFFFYLLYKMFHMFNTQDWIINDGVFVSLLLRISSLVYKDLKWAKCWHPHTYFIHFFFRFATKNHFGHLAIWKRSSPYTYRRGKKYTELKCNLCLIYCIEMHFFLFISI